MDHKKIDLTINTDAVRQILTGFIHSEITRVGFSRAVVNLSGGLDSSLSCYLAAEAMGAENVLALRLPYESSSPDSLEHAQMVIDALGVQSLTIPITGMADALIQQFPEMNRIRQGNIMARMRMICLYDQTEAFHGLAVGTGNKTEILLGYTTLYGDSASAMNPLGDLYKTQVRQLSKAMGVPQVIIDKLDTAQQHAVGIRALHLGDERLDAVGHGIEARPGGNVPRLGPGEKRVDNGQGRMDIRGAHQHLHPGFGIADLQVRGFSGRLPCRRSQSRLECLLFMADRPG